MNSFEVRKKFIDFFLKNQHNILPSSSLIPNNDPSLLFVNAGMNQFKDVFLGSKPIKDIFSFAGLKAPAASNVITIQKCLRAGGKHNDLEAVGDSPFHHTFFEMLGNFSFGGYFKKEAIALAWEFLTKELKIPKEHLWVSVHEKDEESHQIWKTEQKIPKHKIYRLGDKDNFWQMGETGPCGFCTEIHYFNGAEKQPQPEQLTEIWNLVFMEFHDKENGEREKLSVPCVDTGMGLERLCSILQNKKSSYHSNLFSEIILSLEKASGCQYDFEESSQTERQKAFRVLADHSRAICFLIADDVIPGNEKESYILRRIIRRALYYSQKLQPEKNLLQAAVNTNISLMNEWGSLLNQDKNTAPASRDYLSLKEDQTKIQSIIEAETKKFFNSLKEGKKQLEKIMAVQQTDREVKKICDSLKLEEKQFKGIKKQLSNSLLPAEALLYLHDTHGFPIDLTRLIAKEKGWTSPSDSEMKQYIQEKITAPINQKEKKQGAEEVLYKTSDNKINKNLIAKIGLKKFLNQYAPCLVPMIKNEIGKTNFTGYKTEQETGQTIFTGLLQLIEWTRPDPLKEQLPKEINPSEKTLQSLSKEITQGSEDWLVLDKTCFYPEGGGPIGDKGLLQTETGKAEVLDCQTTHDLIWLNIRVTQGELRKGQTCEMEVYKKYRQGIKMHHTATHLLNSALRQTLGNSVRQKGSLVEPHFLRFDFSHSVALTQKQIREAEEKVLDHIYQEEDVTPGYKTFEQAQKEGYIYLKGENYPKQVRVLTIGKDSSKELCGGVHVKNSSEIESFKIIKEEGVGSGLRRITAYTGFSLKEWELFLIKQNHELRNYLNSSEFSFSTEIFQPPLKDLTPLKSEALKKDQNLTQKNINSKIIKTDKQNNNFKQVIENKKKLWGGSTEKENPFLQSLEQIEKILKFLRQKIVKLDTAKAEKKFSPINSGLIAVKKTFHPLAEQILQLREFLKLPLPKAESSNDFTQVMFSEENSSSDNLPLDFFKNKKKDIQALKNILTEIQKRELGLENLDKQVKEFCIKNLQARFLILSLPLEDRKILSDLSDFVLSQLKLSVLILFGESQADKHPVFVNLNKKSAVDLSAGDILKKDIAPLMNGKGGGKAHFAQGSVQDKTKIKELENLLIKKWTADGK